MEIEPPEVPGTEGKEDMPQFIGYHEVQDDGYPASSSGKAYVRIPIILQNFVKRQLDELPFHSAAARSAVLPAQPRTAPTV